MLEMLNKRYMPEETQDQSNTNGTDLKTQLGRLYSYAKTKLGIKSTPKLILVNDRENAKKGLAGYTGNYDPATKTIKLYITDRFITDIVKSFMHELVHHYQLENGILCQSQPSVGHYAQTDPTLRKCEEEAFLKSCLLVRDYQDELRYGKIYE